MLTVKYKKEVFSETKTVSAHKIIRVQTVGDFVLYDENEDIINIIDPYYLEIESAADPEIKRKGRENGKT